MSLLVDVRRVRLGCLMMGAGLAACSSTPKPALHPSPTTQVWAPVPAGTDSVAVMLPTPRDFASSSSVRDTYDSATDSTTVSVEVQSQQFSVRRNRPRVTFSFSFHGQNRAEVPGSVILEVKTTQPHVFQGKKGRYAASDMAVDFPTPAFRSVTANQGTDNFLTFEISTADYSRMLVAPEASMTVGAFDILLDGGQVESMRELGSRMWSGE
jgi:hypothetical protein